MNGWGKVYAALCVALAAMVTACWLTWREFHPDRLVTA
jgi:hypothetical protein